MTSPHPTTHPLVPRLDTTGRGVRKSCSPIPGEA